MGRPAVNGPQHYAAAERLLGRVGGFTAEAQDYHADGTGNRWGG